MESFEIIITERAEQDMRSIYTYIANELKEPEIALGQIDRIEDAIDDLTTMPERAAPVRDEHLAAESFRKLLVDNYCVFFLVDTDKKEVQITRVLYARRDWQNII